MLDMFSRDVLLVGTSHEVAYVETIVRLTVDTFVLWSRIKVSGSLTSPTLLTDAV